jgi:MFS transporter, UMF1 family
VSILFNKQTVPWYLYDFATSLLIMNSTLYFSQWIVVENKVPDIWFSLSFIASTVLLVLTAPYFGVRVDTTKHRKQFIWVLTALTAVSGALIEVFGHIQGYYPRIVLTLVASGALNFFYQLAYMVYNTYIKDITQEQFFGKVSGFGGGLGTLGSIVGVVITLPIVNGAVHLFGTGRINVFVPAAVMCFVLAIPMMIMARQQGDHQLFPQDIDKAKSYIAIWQGIWRDLTNVAAYPGVTRILIAFYFFSDAILTLQLYSAIYFDRVLQISDAIKVVIIFLVFGGFAVGAWVGGWLGDKWGNKRLLVWNLFATALSVFIISFSSSLVVYYILFAIFGLTNGAVFANVRALFSRLIPYDKKGQFFGLYSLSERFASIIGPGAWGLIVFLLPSVHAVNYRAAVFFMGVLILIATFILMPLKQR